MKNIPIKTFITIHKYTANILEWKPINKSLITMDKIGINKAKYLLLNFIPAYIEMAIIGVKLGACGSNLMNAKDNINMNGIILFST